MDENRVTGAAREAAGNIKGAVGDLVGDREMQGRGQADQVQGQVENALGQFSDSVRQQPLTYVLAGVGVGWLLGRLRII